MAGMTSHFFNARMTATEMKSAYKKLALTWHPDINKSADALEQMKKINIEFSYWYSRAATEEVKEQKKAEKPEKTEYYENHYDRVFIQSLEEMINWVLAQGLDQQFKVEIIGVFIWISGIEKEHENARNLIKSVGFRGNWKGQDNGPAIYMFKWTPLLKQFNSEKNIDKIRTRYGSQEVKRKPAGRKQLKG